MYLESNEYNIYTLAHKTITTKHVHISWNHRLDTFLNNIIFGTWPPCQTIQIFQAAPPVSTCCCRPYLLP